MAQNGGREDGCIFGYEISNPTVFDNTTILELEFTGCVLLLARYVSTYSMNYVKNTYKQNKFLNRKPHNKSIGF